MKQELICIGCPMGCQLTAEVENGAVTVQAPAAIGDVVLRDVCGTGVDVTAAKNMEKI